MVQITWFLISLSACIAPALAAVFFIQRRRKASVAGRHKPFDELRRRPAGEALRLKIIDYDERDLERLGLLCLLPVLVGLPIIFSKATGWATVGFALAASSLISAILARTLYRLLKERDAYQLGYDGERYVGEELNCLIAHGFQIYHDVPFDGFNVDHVLAGPPGIFSIETKTRRKPEDHSGAKEFKVVFDGLALQWPKGTDSKSLQQAAANASTLSQWLTNAVGEPVPVTAILTLPGWLVQRKAPPNGVYVTNPKEIAKICVGNRINIEATLLRRITHQLDQKCSIEI